MTVVRKVCYLLLGYVCAFILAYLIPEQIDRRDDARAVVSYARDPTQENEAALRAERRENERVPLRDSAALGLYWLSWIRNLGRAQIHDTRTSNWQAGTRAMI